jgi:hypothetical protein
MQLQSVFITWFFSDSLYHKNIRKLYFVTQKVSNGVSAHIFSPESESRNETNETTNYLSYQQPSSKFHRSLHPSITRVALG